MYTNQMIKICERTYLEGSPGDGERVKIVPNNDSIAYNYLNLFGKNELGHKCPKLGFLKPVGFHFTEQDAPVDAQ